MLVHPTPEAQAAFNDNPAQARETLARYTAATRRKHGLAIAINRRITRQRAARAHRPVPMCLRVDRLHIFHMTAEGDACRVPTVETAA